MTRKGNSWKAAQAVAKISMKMAAKDIILTSNSQTKVTACDLLKETTE